MYTAAAAVGVGMLSPTLRPSASSLPLLKQSQASPPFPREGGEKTGNSKNGHHSIINNNNNNNNNTNTNMAAGLAQAYSRQSQSDSLKLQTAASLVYAAHMRQEGFPYGLSGVPTMTSYNYSSELYGYASNGFPRKSRICSYCSKVFTRSTTRRYHEKRCPLLRAAGSLMKGSSSSSSARNGYNREQSESGVGGGVLSQPPPLIPAGADSVSPSLAGSKSTSVNTSPTSEGLAPIARAQTFNSSQFYNMYGSQFNRTTMSTSSESAGQTAVPPACAGRQSALDHNQNSIMPVVKQEPQTEPTDHEKHERVNGDALLLRSVPSAPAEEENQDQNVYGTSSPRSRSEEEGAESDDGGEQGMKPPVQNHLEDSTYMQQLALKRLKLAQLMALRNSQGMGRPANMLYFPVPCVTNAEDKPPLPPPPPPQPEADARNNTPQKDQESFLHHHATYQPYNNLENRQVENGFENPPAHPEDDRGGNQEDDDNTESYYEPHDTMENKDVEEEEETEEEKKCGVCKEEFEHRKGLLTHMRFHQKYKPNCCRYCGQRFIKLSMRIAHQRTHVGNFSLGCVVCGLHVLSKFGLRQHMHREHYHISVGITECRYCHAIIENVYDLRVHFLAHREEVASSERFSIQFLRMPLLPELAVSPLEEDPSHEHPPASIESKASHDSPTNMEPEPAQGPPPLMLASGSPPVLEQDTYRPNGATTMGRSREKDWCRICEKEIPKSAMRYHEREHADQKPYECPLCKKRFGYKNNMKSHMKLHAGIKPYECQYCRARFTRGSTLRRHARRHGIVSDTIWDFFVRKNAASRTAVYNSQAVNHAITAAPERQNPTQSQLSPLNAGTRAMKADSMYMAGMKPVEPVTLDKNRQISGFPSPGGSGPQPVMTSSYPVVPAGPQPMLQPCMTTHQYLRYAASFSSAAAHPPPPPQPQPPESDEALDFSMPDNQRRRNSSSSSSISTQRSPSSSSSLGMSPSLLVAGQAPHCQSLPPTLDRRRSIDSYSDEREIQEERRRNTISFHRSYYHFNKMRAAGRYGVREGPEHHHISPHSKHVMESRPHAAPTQSDSHTNNTSATQDPGCCYNPTTLSKDPYPQKFNPGGCNALDMTVSPRMGSSKSSPWLEHLEEESVEKLLSSGRLFHCRPCDCYYTDLTMFRIHSKIHVPDHPYLCFLCREDCQDKVTFSRHMLAHLR
ncbi:hypothetical protein ACOMHN_041264 [Nucella lapillus]